MDPQKPAQGGQNGAPDMNKSTLEGLHSEGIDIDNDSQASIDNEFTSVGQQETQQTDETESPSGFFQKLPRQPQPEMQKPSPISQSKPEVETSRPIEAPAGVGHDEHNAMMKEILGMNYAEGPVKNDPSIKPLRTFKSDAEEAVRYQNVSTVDIAVAEQKRRDARPVETVKEEKKSSAGIYIVMFIFIVLAAGGGWYYWSLLKEPTVEVKASTLTIPTLISAAKGETLVLDPDENAIETISKKLSTVDAGLGNVYALVPVDFATSTSFSPVKEVFAKTHMPDRLERSLGSTYMVGAYTYSLTGPFIVLKNTFFQNAFAGMLEWEENLRNDMLPFIRINHPDAMASATKGDKFEDTVVSNVDTRVLRSPQGEVLLAYAFADKDTIVMTTDTATLKVLLVKLLAVKTIQ